MNLNSDRIEAFFALAQTLNYSKAAEKLHLSQPALSKKIAKLEDELAVTLFLRTKRKVELTEAGLELIRYWQSKQDLDLEFLRSIGQGEGEVSGEVRLGGPSSLISSILIPTLAPIRSKHPGIIFDVRSRELQDLPILLLQGEVDFVITNSSIERPQVESAIIGQEEIIHVRPRNAALELPFLDHDPQDSVTQNFFRSQGTKTEKFRRLFFDDIHNIIAGVKAGFGQAVISGHLFNRESMVVVKHKKRIYHPIYLSRLRRTYSPAHHRIVEEFLKKCF